jgi:hypothetical protein
MLALDLRSRLACLLDDQIRAVLLDHVFNARFLVARKYDEASEVRRDPVVLRRRKLDPFDAVVIRALAMKREGLLDTMFLRTLIDAFVDSPKHLFVARRAVREVHRNIFARVRLEHAAGADLGSTCR